MKRTTIRIEKHLNITLVSSSHSTFGEFTEFVLSTGYTTDEPTIWDLSCIDFSKVSNEEQRIFLARAAPEFRKRPGLLIAIVAPDDLQFGMMRAMQTMGELHYNIPIRFVVLKSLKAAQAWLKEYSNRI